MLGCAVHCDRREAFIGNIQRLSIDLQRAIVDYIKQVRWMPFHLLSRAGYVATLIRLFGRLLPAELVKS